MRALMRSANSFTADLFLPYDSIIQQFLLFVNMRQNNYGAYTLKYEIVQNIQKKQLQK